MSLKTLRVLKILNCNLKPAWKYSRKFSRRYGFHVDPLPTKYGGKANVTILPGVGVGPEIMESTLNILTAAQAPLSFEILTISAGEEEEEADEEFEHILTSIRRNKVALKGNIETKSKNPLAKSRNSLLRKKLDLFVYVLCCKSYPGLKSRFKNIDVVVIRQNTEGEYLMLEHMPTPGAVENLKIITRYASERLAKFAFEYALKHNRKLITVVHSAVIHKKSEGLFLQAALEVSKNYPTIKVNMSDVNVSVQTIVMNPGAFDIILTTNLNGALISNILNGMVGGPGLTAGSNYGENGLAVFEPGARNKASSIAGMGTANPISMIMAAINLLKYLGDAKTSQILQHSVYATLVQDKVLTQDLGGTATTEQITANVIKHVRKQVRPKVMREVLRPQYWKSHCNMPEDIKPQKNDGERRVT